LGEFGNLDRRVKAGAGHEFAWMPTWPRARTERCHGNGGSQQRERCPVSTGENSGVARSAGVRGIPASNNCKNLSRRSQVTSAPDGWTNDKHRAGRTARDNCRHASEDEASEATPTACANCDQTCAYLGRTLDDYFGGHTMGHFRQCRCASFL
jgi:hypothetical protein